MTWKNPNPYNSEAYYDLGLTLFYQGRYEEAYDAFFKATWTNEQQEMSFYFLAAIASMKKDYLSALELVEKGLVKNSHNIKARGLKASTSKLGCTEQAENGSQKILEIDCFDFVSSYEEILLSQPEEQNNRKQLLKAKMRNFHQNFIQAAIDYMEGGFWQEAAGSSEYLRCTVAMLYYYRGAALKNMGEEEKAAEMFRLADKADPSYCFPNRLEDINVLKMQWKISLNARKLTIILETFGMTNASIKKQRKTGKWQPNWIHSIRLYSETLLLFITINQMNRRRPVRYWKRRLALTHQMPEFSLNLISYTKNLVCQQRTGLLFMRNMQIRL